MSEISSSKGARIDVGMNPNIPSSARMNEEEKKRLADVNRVLNEMEQKHGKTGNLEPIRGMDRLSQAEQEIPSPTPPNAMRTMYGDEQRERAEAAEQKQRALEAEQRAEANRARPTKNPIITRLQAQRQRPFGRVRTAFENEAQRLRHPDTKAVRRFGRELVTTPIKTLGNIGESALIERTRPQVTETVAPDNDYKWPNGKVGRYIKTVSKTWKESNPFSSTAYESTTKYSTDENGKWISQPLQAEQVTSRRRSPITAQERRKSAMRFKDVLNGAEIGSELSELRDITHSGNEGYGLAGLVGTHRRGGIGAGLYGRGGIGLQQINLGGGQQRQKPTSSGKKGGKKAKAAPNAPITATEMRMATGRGVAPSTGGQQIRSRPMMVQAPQQVQATGPQPAPGSPQQMPALQAQSATPFAGYSPQYSQYGQRYQNQVSRWVGGRPKVVGFLSQDEQPLAWNLVRAQQRFNIYTGLNPSRIVNQPYLSQDALREEAGLTHSQGPSHDFGNQIFNPGYGVYRLRGNGQLGNTDVLGMFLGKRLPMQSPRFASAPRPVRGNLGQIKQITLNKGKLSVVKKGGQK